MLRYARKTLSREFKAVQIENMLSKIGIKKVDSKFLNELDDKGLKNLLTISYNVMTWESQFNPTAGLPKDLAGLLALSNLGKPRPDVVNPIQ